MIHNKQHYTLPILTTVCLRLVRRVKIVSCPPPDGVTGAGKFISLEKTVLLESRGKMSLIFLMGGGYFCV